jgi:FAD/FMN-containing dehydrogenase
MPISQVERIGCANHGLFVMNFTIQWLDDQGVWHTSNWNSGNFNWGEYAVSPPLSSIGVPTNALAVTPYVSAIAGVSNRATPVVQNANNGRLATYDVDGVTWQFTVTPLPWANWARNIVHTMTVDGQYYFAPTGHDALRDIVHQAAAAGATLRVSGQRHSQPPLVTTDNRTAPNPQQWLVDLSCYADLGPNGDQRIVLNGDRVTVNTGVREDELDTFLTANNLMLRTVTAGGFFSLGGMTSVDVHGATVDAPIFAETASEFAIMGADGEVTVINATTPSEGGWAPLQFARVSFGALGIVTSVTVDVLPRPWATTLRPGKGQFTIPDQQTFIAQFKPLLASHDRIESFVNPYTNNFLALWWDIDGSPPVKTPNQKSTVPTACVLAGKDEFGAPYIGPTEPVAELVLIKAQYSGSTTIASGTIDTGYLAIENFYNNAVAAYSDLWLTWASRVIFMSYFVELPAIDDAGLGKAWQGLNAVITRLQASNDFLLVAPLEFRFVRGGDSALSGTYTTTPNATFVNLDMIGYVKATPASEYPNELLSFFADIERAWVALGGSPHNGKMYGFYDPGQPPGTFSPPFNPAFLRKLASDRATRVQAFDAYRRTRDPNGLFGNDFVSALLGRSI